MILFKHTQAYQVLSKHASLKKVAWCLFYFFIGLIVFIALMPWQQTANGNGRVVAFSPNEREQNIIATMPGRLEHWSVHDGSEVKAGDRIVEIIDNDPQLLSRLKEQLDALKLRLRAIETGMALAKINVARQKQLFEEGISSKRTYEKARFELLEYESQEADTQVEITNLKVKISRQHSQVIKAPMAGVILKRVTGQASVLVHPGDVLAVLVPNTHSRSAAVWLNGNEIPLVKVGQHVRLQFEGWPAIQFSGWPSVAVGTFGGTVAVVDPIDNGRGKFRILVVPEHPQDWPSAVFLRQGVRVSAWVLLNRVKVWFELWRRFNGFPPTMPKDAWYEPPSGGGA